MGADAGDYEDNGVPTEHGGKFRFVYRTPEESMQWTGGGGGGRRMEH